METLITIALGLVVVVLVILPPHLDPAIRWKEWNERRRSIERLKKIASRVNRDIE